MTNPILYIDRLSGKKCEEAIYGEAFLRYFYGEQKSGRLLNQLISKNATCSHFYGWLQSLKSSRNKIPPFIEKYQIDPSEFLDSVDSFSSFNDFFTRKLKPEARPIAESAAIIPADGRYLVFPHVEKAQGFWVKGEKFCVERLVESEQLARPYKEGSMVIARLCPTDYHRFHFPCAGIPEKPQLINGHLFSVNPIALKQNIHIFTENKRMITEFETEAFGKVLYIEIGATNVGTIHQTFTPNRQYEKGDEKGFFSFGGSSLILLFEPGRIVFDKDLIAPSMEPMEVRCLMGQSLGSIERAV